MAAPRCSPQGQLALLVWLGLRTIPLVCSPQRTLRTLQALCMTLLVGSLPRTLLFFPALRMIALVGSPRRPLRTGSLAAHSPPQSRRIDIHFPQVQSLWASLHLECLPGAILHSRAAHHLDQTFCPLACSEVQEESEHLFSRLSPSQPKQASLLAEQSLLPLSLVSTSAQGHKPIHASQRPLACPLTSPTEGLRAPQHHATGDCRLPFLRRHLQPEVAEPATSVASALLVVEGCQNGRCQQKCECDQRLVGVLVPTAPPQVA
mmetsp:Transcript_5161/g.12394  ORF Transcript_5161/g.12394 Transcript_5161/m.12394 type:complete len:262 (+) Transcript_5161:262-1047(+)